MLPSFKERIAFVNSLKRRWREQKGYCSVFDRVRADKLMKEKKEFKRLMRHERKMQGKQLSQGNIGQQLPQINDEKNINRVQELQSRANDLFTVLGESSEAQKRSRSVSNQRSEIKKFNAGDNSDLINAHFTNNMRTLSDFGENSSVARIGNTMKQSDMNTLTETLKAR